MFKITNAELLAPVGLKQCWFYFKRVSDQLEIASLVRLFCEHMLTGMETGELCVFYITGKDHVKLLKSEASGWELEILNAADSRPFIDLEWLLTL